MPIVLNPEKWQNFCMPEDKKKKERKEIEPIFSETLFHTKS